MSREERLDELLADRDLDAVWFARPNSFAWLTGGSNVVDRASDVGVAAAGYDGDRIEVVTNNIEGERLREEELPDDIEVTEYEWYERSLAEAVADHSPTPAAADFDVPGFESVDASPLRQPLTDADVERYRELGRETAEAVEAICRELESTDTEHEVASGVRIALSARGIEAPVVLVGGSERAQKYRHFTPQQGEQLGDYALVSVTAERDGLFASMTRTVVFDEPDWFAERYTAAAHVQVSAVAATHAVAGLSGKVSSVFENIKAAYERAGYPEEWRNHHQGGAAGFAGREWIATPDSDAEVRTPMAYAWNPTIQGVKSEDTVLVTDDSYEVLTDSGNWPTNPTGAYDHEAALPLADYLVMDE